MKIEINKDVVEKVLNRKRRRKFISKKNINKSYYILLVFMVGLASAGLYTNINNNYDDSVRSSKVKTVFSNSKDEFTLKECDINEKFMQEIKSDLNFLIDKSSLINCEYSDGIAKFEMNGKNNVYSIFEGTIENIYLDYCYGYTVVVNRGDNIRIKYCNLDSNINLNIGERVEKGQIIGLSVEHSLIDSSYIYVILYYNNEPINIINLFEI